jgi:hypothetical protein
MCLSLGKSLPSLRHFNQKGLEPRINGRASVLQTPHSVSLAIFSDRHLLFPQLTNEAFELAASGHQEMELGCTPSRAPRFGLQKISGLKQRFRGP